MTFDGVTVKYAGGRFLMNHRVQSSLVASLPLSLTLKPSFSLGVPRTGSASERLML